MHVLRSSPSFISLLGLLALYVAGCGSGVNRAPGAAATTTPATPPATPSPDPAPSPAPAPASSTDTVIITEPASGTTLSSPFTLSASAATCSSQPVSSMGYSFDTASATTIQSASIDAQVSAAAGAHTLNVTAWGNGGAVCTASVAITVAALAQSSPVPANAISVGSIQAMSGWQLNHDPAAGATSSGSMSMVGSPSLSGSARQFNTSFSGSGGEIYHISWGNDATAHNFFYDAWVYFDSSVNTVANLEMDMNQVVANGDTIIYGFQCDGYSGTWDYTENAGTPSSTVDRWVHSSAPCNVRKWTQNQWHHIQISYQRDDSGNVTYHSVWLDGAQAQIEATVPSAFALSWGPTLLTNFQIDGLGSGSNTVYLDNLTISRW